MLARNTDWRQGNLLTCEAAATLGLVGATDQGRRVIVITHDCDLPHDSELCVEVIVAELVVKDPKPDPQLSYAKNPRRLHLAYEATDAVPLILELRHGDRRSVPKGDFAERAVKDNSLALQVDARRGWHWGGAECLQRLGPDFHRSATYYSNAPHTGRSGVN